MARVAGHPDPCDDGDEDGDNENDCDNHGGHVPKTEVSFTHICFSDETLLRPDFGHNCTHVAVTCSSNKQVCTLFFLDIPRGLCWVHQYFSLMAL